MKVYERLALAFKGEGTTHVFGMIGDGNMHWINALHSLGNVQQIEVRHEGVALGMADGWARHTRTPGICTATCGPGVTQLGTALVTAARARSPLVAFVGESPRRDPEYSQRFDQAPFAAACEAGYVRVETPDHADDAVRKAFYKAKTESRPVLLGAPIDVQEEDCDDDDPYLPSARLLDTRQYPPMETQALQRALELVRTARRPVIIAGQGALWSGAGQAIQHLAELTGALIATTLRTKNWMSHHPYHAGISGLYASRAAIELFNEADVVIAVGASMNQYTTEHGYLYPEAKYIQIDNSPHATIGMSQGADCYLYGDARVGAEAMAAALADAGHSATGYRTPEVRQLLENQYEDSAPYEIEDDRLDPRELCRVLDEVLPAKIGLLIGTGASSGFPIMAFKRERPFVHSAHYFGCIGQMLPAAMGVIQATGKQPMALIDGDASTMMHLADFDTAVRYRMPLLIIVQNDQALGAEYHKLASQSMHADLAAVPTPDLGAVAVALGGHGLLAQTIEQVRQGVEAWLKHPVPTLIDVRISRRVLTLPYRRLLYGKNE